MHVIYGILAIVMICFAWFSWRGKNVEPGSVGVYYDKPYFFGHGQIRDEIALPGRVLTWASTDIISVSTAPWTIKVHVDDMMSANRVPLDFDVAITVQIDKNASAPYLIREFNGGPVAAFERVALQGINMQTLTVANPSGEFMSYLRDRVRERHMDEFMVATREDANKKKEHSDASADVEKQIVEYMNRFLRERQVPVLVKNVALGRANPPDGIKASMERTAEQVQQKQTELDRTEAQRNRKAAEEASAEADKAQQNKLGFTNEQYLKKLELETILKICGSNAKDMKDTKGTTTSCTIVYGQALPTVQLR